MEGTGSVLQSCVDSEVSLSPRATEMRMYSTIVPTSEAVLLIFQLASVGVFICN